jgi:hypothetical protein
MAESSSDKTGFILNLGTTDKKQTKTKRTAKNSDEFFSSLRL